MEEDTLGYDIVSIESGLSNVFQGHHVSFDYLNGASSSSSEESSIVVGEPPQPLEMEDAGTPFKCIVHLL